MDEHTTRPAISALGDRLDRAERIAKGEPKETRPLTEQVRDHAAAD